MGTFQARTMIVNSSGQILPKTVHDHEATPTKRGRWDCRWGDVASTGGGQGGDLRLGRDVDAVALGGPGGTVAGGVRAALPGRRGECRGCRGAGRRNGAVAAGRQRATELDPGRCV